MQLNTCVGRGNYRYFVCFLFHTWASTSYLCLLILLVFLAKVQTDMHIPSAALTLTSPGALRNATYHTHHTQPVAVSMLPTALEVRANLRHSNTITSTITSSSISSSVNAVQESRRSWGMWVEVAGQRLQGVWESRMRGLSPELALLVAFMLASAVALGTALLLAFHAFLGNSHAISHILIPFSPALLCSHLISPG